MITTSENLDKIAPALVDVFGLAEAMKRDASNPHFHSTYTTLTAIGEYVRPMLHKAGICVVQGFADVGPSVIGITTRLLHRSGQWMETTLPMPLVPAPSKAGKPPKPIGPQQAGSAITYGRRYAIGAMLFLITDTDDDGNQAQQPTAQEDLGALLEGLEV